MLKYNFMELIMMKQNLMSKLMSMSMGDKIAFMKGQAAGGLSASAIAVIILVIVVAIGATILSTIRDTQTSGTTAFNVTTKGLDSLKTYSDFFSTIVIIVIFAVIIGLLAFFSFRGGRSEGGL